MRIDDAEAGDADALARRGAFIRTGTGVYLVLTAPLSILAIVSPGLFGLGRGLATVLSLSQVAVLVAVAVAPWERILARRGGGAWLAVLHLELAGAVGVGAWMSTPFRPEIAALLLLVLAFSALTATPSGHVVAVVGCLTIWILVAVGRSADWGEIALWSFLVAAVAGLFGLLARSSRTAEAVADRARMEAQRSARLIAAAATSAGALSSLDVERIVAAVVEAAASLGSELAGIYVLEPGDRLRLAASVGMPDGPPVSRVAAPGLAGTVLDHGGTIVVDDYAAMPYAIAEYVALGLGSSVGVPIRARSGAAAGVLVAGRHGVAPYDGQEVQVLELLARHAGRALDVAEESRARVELAERHRLVDRREDDLVTTVSHEFRTPLTIIQGMSETLAGRWAGLDDERRQEMLGRISDNAVALRAILENILELGRLDSDWLPSRLASFDLGELVATTVRRLGPTLADHEFVAPPSRPLAVRGDEMLIERVLDNLLGNAVAHTPPGTRVELRVTPDASAGTVDVAVVDDGPGIDSDDLGRVTERFFRGGDANARPRGLGVGLALAAEIVRRHGSTLRIASEGRGTSFAFTLDLSGSSTPRSQAPRVEGG